MPANGRWDLTRRLKGCRLVYFKIKYEPVRKYVFTKLNPYPANVENMVSS